MKTNGIILAVLLIFCSWTTAAWADQPMIHLGISAQSVPNFNRNDAQSAIKVWAQTVSQERQLTEKFEVRIVDSLAELRRNLKDHHLDAVSLTAKEFLQLELQPDEIYVTATDAGFQTRYALVVHRDSGVTTLDGLKNRRVAIPQGQFMTLAGTWLDAQILDHAQATSRSWLAEVSQPDNPAKGVLQVFFRQIDAAVLTVDALELAGELNPQLLRDLVIIRESEPLITAFFLFRPLWQGPSRETIEDALLSLHTTPAGQQVLTVFQSSHMEKQPATILEPTLAFLRKNMAAWKAGDEP